MTPELLAKIKDLVEAGATVVGPRPVRSPSLSGYPECDRQVERLAAELWGDCDGKRRHGAPFRARQDRLGQDARDGAGRDGRRGPISSASRFPARSAISIAGGRYGRLFRRQRGAQGAGGALHLPRRRQASGVLASRYRPIEPAAVYRPTKPKARKSPLPWDPVARCSWCSDPRPTRRRRDRVDSLTRDGRSVLLPAMKAVATGAAGESRSSGPSTASRPSSAQSRDVTALVRRLVDRGIEGFWVRICHARQRGAGRDEDLDGRLHDRRPSSAGGEPPIAS